MRVQRQSHAFNAMLGSLRWFEVYVTKTIVSRMMQEHTDRSANSSEREVTVMFTDITGFTGIAEGIDTESLTGLLNANFATIDTVVEAKGGTVNKLIGDAANFAQRLEQLAYGSKRYRNHHLNVRTGIRSPSDRRAQSSRAAGRDQGTQPDLIVRTQESAGHLVDDRRFEEILLGASSKASIIEHEVVL